jgi:hypothetical protein
MFFCYNSGTKKKLKEHFDKEIAEYQYDSLSDEDKFELESNFCDDLYFYEQMEELSYEMTIIAFYKTIEITIKNMLKCSEIFTEEEVKEFYKAKIMKCKIDKNICKIEELDGYAAYNELRLINNCIKHSGIITEELSSNYHIWKVGEKLKNLDEVYLRLKEDVYKYINSLKNEILKKIQ